MKRRKKNVVFENDRTVLQPVLFSDAGEKSRAILVPQIDNLDELSSYKNLRRKRIRLAITRSVLWTVIVLLLPIIIFITVVVFSPNSGHSFFGYTYYLVTTESMRPEIDVGDMIVVKTNFTIDDIEIGTDITFIRDFDEKVVTHRVRSYEDTEEGRVYITRGINTTFYDDPINFNNILGVKIRVDAGLGKIVTFFRSTVGMITMFSFFAALFVGFYFSFKYSNDIRAVGK